MLSFVRKYIDVLSLLALASLIVALARPQHRLQEEKINAEAIDIVIAADVSGSMLARDFQPDRLGAAKNVAKEFIANRESDRIGLVVFSGESFTQCPITTDHDVLVNQLRSIKSGMIADGTAIGNGLATAINRLKESEAKSKVIILMTDGVNNAGFIEPLTAAETAKEFGIKVYTIGVGTMGTAPMPVQSVFGIQLRQSKVEIDEPLLRRIAKETNGKYFRATDNQSLMNIYNEIDELEKTEIEVTTINRYSEEFHRFAWAGLILLLLNFLLRNTILKSLF